MGASFVWAMQIGVNEIERASRASGRGREWVGIELASKARLTNQIRSSIRRNTKSKNHFVFDYVLNSIMAVVGKATMPERPICRQSGDGAMGRL